MGEQVIQEERNVVILPKDAKFNVVLRALQELFPNSRHNYEVLKPENRVVK
jgi:hypothetical protein